MIKAVLFSAVIGSVAARNDQQAFLDFLQTHRKTYTADELFYRFGVFQQNLALIEEHNSQNLSYTLGVNQFADLTSVEFEKIYLGYIPREAPRNEASEEELGVPAAGEIDWFAKGAVTPIKDQAQCGSCWAFSTTGSMESAVYLKKGTLLSLSEQQLVDCSGSAGNQGCNGGLMDNAFKWIIQNKGLGSEASYPYTARDGTCKRVDSVATITSYKDVPAKSESGLQAALATQPVSIAVDARKWQLYRTGVFDGCSTLIQLDHGVLAVGVSESNGYWLVKNSWGTTWGEKGFIRLKKGKNECGLSNAASYPIA